MRTAFLILLLKAEYILYLILCAIVAYGIICLTSANASVTPKQDALATRPDTKPTRKRCIQQVRTIRLLISPDGKIEYEGGYTVWTACD